MGFFFSESAYIVYAVSAKDGALSYPGMPVLLPLLLYSRERNHIKMHQRRFAYEILGRVVLFISNFSLAFYLQLMTDLLIRY